MHHIITWFNQTLKAEPLECAKYGGSFVGKSDSFGATETLQTPKESSWNFESFFKIVKQLEESPIERKWGKKVMNEIVGIYRQMYTPPIIFYIFLGPFFPNWHDKDNFKLDSSYLFFSNKMW